MGLRVILNLNIGKNIIIFRNPRFNEGDVQRPDKAQRHSLHALVQQSVPDCKFLIKFIIYMTAIYRNDK
jgi:hypothetical protein